METIPIETAAAVMETVAEDVTQVIEVVESVDYMPLIQECLTSLQNQESLLGYLVSFSLFAVIVCLCYFSYKFFRIFF